MHATAADCLSSSIVLPKKASRYPVVKTLKQAQKMGLLTRVQTFKSNLVIKVSIIDVRMQAKNSGFDSIVDSELQNGNHDCVNLGFSGWA